jgi:CubicO group peptidase (beta-lactamase class C family)
MNMLRRPPLISYPILRLILIISLSLSVTAKAQNQTPENVTARVDKVFAQWDKPDSPGCALAVIKDGNIIYKRGYGIANLDYDIPITPSTPFHVASVSKQFTATAIALLAREGKLSLDDDIRKYIPEVPDLGHKITIRHLVHHTSGLRDQWSLLVMAGWRLSNDVVKDEDVLDLVSRQKALNFKPGDQHLYSNTGYTLMALIVKRVSGKSLREFTEERIFKPLGMSKTFFRDDHTVVVKNQAIGYEPGGPTKFKLSVPNYDTVGASSLITTVEDMAKWDQNFYTPNVGDADLIKQLETPVALNNGYKLNYAMGMVVGQYKGLRVVEHSGADAGYRSHYMRFPDQRFSIVILCNLSFAFPNQLARNVADIYLAGQLKEDSPDTTAVSNPVTLSEQQLAAKIGPYWCDATGDLARVTVSDGKLTAALPGLTAKLIPLAEDRFQIEGRKTIVTFDSSNNGQPLRMTVKPEAGFPMIFEAVPPASLTAAEMADYVGAYYSEEIDSVYTVKLDGGKLVLKRKKNDPMTLDPAFEDAFVTGQFFGIARFERDSSGRVTGFRLFAGRIRNFQFVKQVSDNGAK